MGEAKHKQYDRDEFLKRHPFCCYCGAAATTTDHCPPRGLFRDRIWPEGYEFPACAPCNQEGRKLEGIISVIYRITLNTDNRDKNLKAAIDGLKRYSPEVAAELTSGSRRWQRNAFREQFGEAGDEMRKKGYGMGTIGPKSSEAIDYFGGKLGKALYYKYVGRRFDGRLFCRSIYLNRYPDFFKALVAMAPAIPKISRNGKDLSDQFNYRYNYSPEQGLFYAVVGFREQLGYNVFAVDHAFYDAFVKLHPDMDDALNEIYNRKQPAAEEA